MARQLRRRESLQALEIYEKLSPETLESYRHDALECCPRCRSGFFRREGDLLAEQEEGRGIDRGGLVSLDSPKGYFSDSLACLVIYVGGGDTDHDAIALDHIAHFKRGSAAAAGKTC